MSGSADVARSSTDDGEGDAAASGDPLLSEAAGSAVGPGRITGEGGVRACTACAVLLKFHYMPCMCGPPIGRKTSVLQVLALQPDGAQGPRHCGRPGTGCCHTTSLREQIEAVSPSDAGWMRHSPLPQQCSQEMRVWMLLPVAVVRRPLHRNRPMDEHTARDADGFMRYSHMTHVCEKAELKP